MVSYLRSIYQRLFFPCSPSHSTQGSVICSLISFIFNLSPIVNSVPLFKFSQNTYFYFLQLNNPSCISFSSFYTFNFYLFILFFFSAYIFYQIFQFQIIVDRDFIKDKLQQIDQIEKNSIEEMQIQQEDYPVKQFNNKIQQDENQVQHKNLNHNSLYYTFMERYFTNFQNQHQYLHLHSNGICLISVKRQSLPGEPKQIKEFIQVSEVKGKKKKGGIRVQPQSIIAKIVCENGSQVPIYALIEGTILQKNDSLTIDKIGKAEGFFIIILPYKKVIPQKFGMKKLIIDHLGQ